MPNDSSYNGIPYSASDGLEQNQADNNEQLQNTTTTAATIDFAFPTSQKPHSIIKVVGVGGGGSNAVSHMFQEGIQDVSFLIINTDWQALKGSPIPNKLQISDKGLGAGAKPEIAKKYALEYENDIRNALNDGTEMVFITAGMGGGTGTGASPVVARVAKELGLLTVGIVTIPFQFEGMDKISMALDGVASIKQYVDALLVVNNNRLINIYPDLTFFNAFKKADDTLTTAAKSISDIINIEGHINLDFADVRTTLENGGVALISTGEAAGDSRVTKAIQNATTSPLLQDNNISNAKHLLFELCFSESKPVSMSEIGELNKFVDGLDKNIKVIWGAMVDNSLGDNVRIILLASGFEIDPTNKDTPIVPAGELTPEAIIEARRTAELEKLRKEEEENKRKEIERQKELERIRLEEERKENLKRYKDLVNLKEAMAAVNMPFPDAQAAELLELERKLGFTPDTPTQEPTETPHPFGQPAAAPIENPSIVTTVLPTTPTTGEGQSSLLQSVNDSGSSNPTATKEPDWDAMQREFERKKVAEAAQQADPAPAQGSGPVSVQNPAHEEPLPMGPATSVADGIERIRKYYGNDAADEMMRDKARENYYILNQEDLTNDELISNLEKLPAYERQKDVLEQLRNNTRTTNRPISDDTIPFNS